MDGLLVVDKPDGPTSHDVVARVRRLLGERRIGHTGTLDPAATGVLPLVLGRATRLARFLRAADKSYEAVVRLGVVTDTGDADGPRRAGATHGGPLPPRDAIEPRSTLSAARSCSGRPRIPRRRSTGSGSYKLARRRRGERVGSLAAAGTDLHLPRTSNPDPVPAGARDRHRARRARSVSVWMATRVTSARRLLRRLLRPVAGARPRRAPRRRRAPGRAAADAQRRDDARRRAPDRRG